MKYVTSTFTTKQSSIAHWTQKVQGRRGNVLQEHDDLKDNTVVAM